MDPFVGEIRIFGGNFEPLGWAFCDGRVLNKADYPTLFELIGGAYGGNGVTTFALPDLRGRLPMHRSDGHPVGERAGSETIALSESQMPPHSHAVQATSAAADRVNPGGALLAATRHSACANLPASPAAMSADAVSQAGGELHSNLQPFLCCSFIIALGGIYPSQ